MRTVKAVGTDLLFTASLIGGAALAIAVSAASLAVNKVMTAADNNLWVEPDPSDDLGKGA